MAPCKLEKFKSYIQLKLSEALNLSEQFILFLAFNLVTDWAQTIKGSVNRLSHGCHLDIDRDVSNAYCMSSTFIRR